MGINFFFFCLALVGVRESVWLWVLRILRAKLYFYADTLWVYCKHHFIIDCDALSASAGGFACERRVVFLLTYDISPSPFSIEFTKKFKLFLSFKFIVMTLIFPSRSTFLWMFEFVLEKILRDFKFYDRGQDIWNFDRAEAIRNPDPKGFNLNARTSRCRWSWRSAC